MHGCPCAAPAVLLFLLLQSTLAMRSAAATGLFYVKLLALSPARHAVVVSFPHSMCLHSSSLVAGLVASAIYHLYLLCKVVFGGQLLIPHLRCEVVFDCHQQLLLGC